MMSDIFSAAGTIDVTCAPIEEAALDRREGREREGHKAKDQGALSKMPPTADPCFLPLPACGSSRRSLRACELERHTLYRCASLLSGSGCAPRLVVSFAGAAKMSLPATKKVGPRRLDARPPRRGAGGGTDGESAERTLRRSSSTGAALPAAHQEVAEGHGARENLPSPGDRRRRRPRAALETAGRTEPVGVKVHEIMNTAPSRT